MTVIDTPPFPNIVRPVSNILDYGADPTGAGDSTMAIANAIAAIPVTGGVLFIPAGVYKVTSTINLQNRNNLTIQGEGSGPGTSGRAASSIIWGGAPSVVVLDVRGTSHCVFRDFGMDPNAISGLTAMQFDGNPTFGASQFNLFENLRFGSLTSGFSVCIQLGVTASTQVSEFTFIQCRFFLFTTYGVQINSSQAADHAFIGCEFQGQNDAGTEIGLEVTRGGFFAYGCSFIKNNVDIDIAALDLPSIVSGFEAEQSNKFLNVTTCGTDLSLDTGYVLVNGAGAGVNGFTFGNLSANGQISLRNIFIDAGKNVSIGATNNATFVVQQVHFPGGGAFTGQVPINTSGGRIDNRSGVTAADGSPITLYAVQAGANQLFRISVEIVATAFTSGTATYTVTWTENGVSQTAVVTATAINVVTGIVRLAMPDASTNITVQLTGVFTATVRISAIAEKMF